jgi:hypothetical protein
MYGVSGQGAFLRRLPMALVPGVTRFITIVGALLPPAMRIECGYQQR